MISVAFTSEGTGWNADELANQDNRQQHGTGTVLANTERDAGRITTIIGAKPKSRAGGCF